MVRLTGPLSDAYLWEIAQHFAALDLPHAAPVPTDAARAPLALQATPSVGCPPAPRAMVSR